MSGNTFLSKYNYDDVFTRAVSIGLINLLNNNIIIWNRISDNKIQEIPIPFYYDASGDERFMNDILLHDTLDDCVDRKMVEGNIDVIPRGWIRMDSCTINVATFTNRFVYGEYTEETDDGELRTYSAPVIIVPLDLTYTAQIKFDSLLDVHKGLQKVIETFYKVNTFKIMYNGMVIQVSAAFPEDHTITKTYEFSFGDDTTPTLDFSLAVETYLPLMDKTKQFAKTNIIESVVIKSSPAIKSFPTYVIPKDKAYVSKTAFSTDDTPEIASPKVVQQPNVMKYPEPVSKDSPYDPGEPNLTPNNSNTGLESRNPDGSIGVPGQPGYIDSYGVAFDETLITTPIFNSEGVIEKVVKTPLKDLVLQSYTESQLAQIPNLNTQAIDELPNVDNNLNAVDRFGIPNSVLPS